MAATLGGRRPQPAATLRRCTGGLFGGREMARGRVAGSSYPIANDFCDVISCEIQLLPSCRSLSSRP